MTPIEIIALIIAIIAGVKILALFINPKSWLPVPKAVFSRPLLLGLVSFVLAAIVLKYLIVELTIIQIYAVFLFISLLLLMSLAPFSSDVAALAARMYKDKAFLKKTWLAMLTWAALTIWVLYALFA